MTFSFFGIASKREYTATLIIIIAVEAFVSLFFGYTVPGLASANIFNTNLILAGTVLSYAINIIAAVLQFAVTARRLRGLGKSPLLTLILIIPIVNIIFGITLIFGPESKEAGSAGSDIEEVDMKIIDAELKKQADDEKDGGSSEMK